MQDGVVIILLLCRRHSKFTPGWPMLLWQRNLRQNLLILGL